MRHQSTQAEPIAPFRIMYIMLNRWAARLGYYGRLFKLGLASILPPIRSKDKASIDACVST